MQALTKIEITNIVTIYTKIIDSISNLKNSNLTQELLKEIVQSLSNISRVAQYCSLATGLEGIFSSETILKTMCALMADETNRELQKLSLQFIGSILGNVKIKKLSQVFLDFHLPS